MQDGHQYQNQDIVLHLLTQNNKGEHDSKLKLTRILTVAIKSILQGTGLVQILGPSNSLYKPLGVV